MQKGFTQIIFIIIILLASGGIVVGSYLIKNNLKNVSSNSAKNVEFNHQQTSQKTPERIDFDSSCFPQDIYKDKAVCIDEAGQVNLLELPSMKKTQITNVTSRKYFAQIEGNYIAWLDERAQVVGSTSTRNGVSGPVRQDRIGQDIFLYNLTTKEEKKITTTPATRTELQLNENYIVWTEQRGDITLENYRKNEIHIFDISLSKEIFSSTVSSTKKQLRLWKDKLVWADSRNGKDTGCDNCANNRFDIYLYDFKTGQEKILVEGPYLKIDPDIEENSLVWIDYRNKMSDVYLMDISTGKEKQITNANDNEVNSRIENGRVFWSVRWACDVGPIKIATGSGSQIKSPSSQFGDLDTGVYVYNLSTQEKKKLTDYVEPSFIVSGNLVVIGEGCHGVKPKVYGIYVD
ncbi:hypothetical protein HYS94_02850 [Candidatus Daviesbacteria bacterium]|nr:hypothetical protein [Candidatus Daviesbacteria bacterium]